MVYNSPAINRHTLRDKVISESQLELSQLQRYTACITLLRLDAIESTLAVVHLQPHHTHHSRVGLLSAFLQDIYHRLSASRT